ncbi:MAG: 2-succinyl-5-enolpyruvyl-6-hydroxy-3-cyclohexene-1-carboxylic-acid synthase, partial [Bacteroidales bacterium]|nr:2-succinyl-5-enolpyruvyl-6-hydroxy-3-cyclohexene-1-carboxylic-acid synthase [Bacteroidales bacterium]
DGQTIRQKEVFANYILKSYELPEEIRTNADRQNAIDLINEAINLSQSPAGGPVHINLPFNEPIYNQVEGLSFPVQVKEPVSDSDIFSPERIKEMAGIWNVSQKKLIIAGMMEPNDTLRQQLKHLAEDPTVVILSETTSNLNECCTISCIDRVVSTFRKEEIET